MSYNNKIKVKSLSIDFQNNYNKYKFQKSNKNPEKNIFTDNIEKSINLLRKNMIISNVYKKEDENTNKNHVIDNFLKKQFKKEDFKSNDDNSKKKQSKSELLNNLMNNKLK